MPIKGKSVGDVHIRVYETPTGETLFYIEADNGNVVPILHYVENSLENYKMH